MNNTGQTDSRQLQIQGLLDRCLQAKSITKNLDAKAGHLDEDMISAFVDGNLLEREAKPIISHLADCSFCRHISSELIKLDMAFADIPQEVGEVSGEPSKVADVLSGIMAKIFGTNDAEVFAHNEEDNEEDNEEKDEEEPTE